MRLPHAPWLSGAALGAALACSPSNVYQCQSDGDCMVSGITGTCQPDLYCSFPSNDCPSGQEYGQHTPPELAGTCVPTGGTGSTGQPPATSGDTVDDSGGPLETTGEATGVETTTGQPPSDPSLVLWLTMDELRGEEILDQSGYGNHAYCIQACPVLGRGVEGAALDFLDGGTSIFVPMTEELFTSEQLTVAVWMKPHVLQGGPAMAIAEIPLAADANPNWNSWELRLEGPEGGFQQLYFATATVAEQSVVVLPEHPLAEGEWHHLVGVWDGEALMLYIDGELWGGAPGLPPDFDGQDLYIGGGLSSGTPDDWFMGILDDFRLYRRALMPDEVQGLYQNPASP